MKVYSACWQKKIILNREIMKNKKIKSYKIQKKKTNDRTIIKYIKDYLLNEYARDKQGMNGCC